VSRYCIKEGYQHRTLNRTVDQNREEEYWTRKREKSSLVYQFPTYRYAQRLVQERKLKQVLDIGCGPAVKLMKLIAPNCKTVTGIDQEQVIERDKERYQGRNAKFYVDNFDKPRLQLKKNFDLIICSDVIEHLEDPDKLLSYVKRFANKKTLILFSTPERDLLRGEGNLLSPKEEHLREWTRRELACYLKEQGFVIEEHFILPSMKPTLTYPFVIEYVKRLLDGTLKHDQVILCKVVR